MNDAEVIEQLKFSLRAARELLKRKFKKDLIKAFEIKEGHKYLIIFDRDSGVPMSEIAGINDPDLINTKFVVNDINKVDIKEQ